MNPRREPDQGRGRHRAHHGLRREVRDQVDHVDSVPGGVGRRPDSAPAPSGRHIRPRRQSRRSTIALLASSSGRFKSSVEAIKAEAITELAAAKSGLTVVRVTAASLKQALGCATGQKWQARAAELFNPTGRHKNWSQGAAGAAAAALKVAGSSTRSMASTALSARPAACLGK